MKANLHAYRLKGYDDPDLGLGLPPLTGSVQPRTEGDVMRAIRDYVERDCGIRLFRASPGTNRRGGKYFRTATTGLPDLFGCLPGGRFIAIEVKKPGARKRADEAAQNEVLAYLKSRGALVIVARSVADVAAVLMPRMAADARP